MKIKKLAGPVPEFETGQVWRMGEDRLQIGLVGKWLVHYRQYTAMNKKLPTQFAARGDLQKFLSSHKAVLVPDQVRMLPGNRVVRRARKRPSVRPACAGARRLPRG